MGLFYYRLKENAMIKRVDQTALKFNQAAIIVLTLLGFIFQRPYLVLFVGLVLAIGAITPDLALFKQIYLKLLKPNKLLKPKIVKDDPTPHQFAQGVGAFFLLVSSSVLLVFGNAIVGWTLAWIVIILAGVNLFFGFCAGCFVYYQLDKAGLIPHKE
jgi:hypothetical protein